PPIHPLFPYTTLFRSTPSAPRIRSARAPQEKMRSSGISVVGSMWCILGYGFVFLNEGLQSALLLLAQRRNPVGSRRGRCLPTARSEEHTSELQSRENL